LRSACTCAEERAGDCHLRSHGVMRVSASDVIVGADSEAVEALRGPAEEWDGDQARTLHDSSFGGGIGRYWEILERLDVGSTGDQHHYLVVRRADDGAVCWIQVCIHRIAADEPLYMWHVRDITGSARCLEMSRLAADGDYALSLENDGLPHATLLTQVPDACPSSNPDTRTELAGILAAVVAAETFAVLHLTGFGAVDTVFPRRVLGWSEGDIVDRSFLGLLCAEDRAFFCQALRRSLRDCIPQRLTLKLLSGRACAGAAAAAYLSCDVTVLMPEAVQQPVLIVRANDQASAGALSVAGSCTVRHGVCRVQLEQLCCVSERPTCPEASSPGLSAAAALSPASEGLSLDNATSFAPATCCPPHPAALAAEPTLVDTGSPELRGYSGAGLALAPSAVGNPSYCQSAAGLVQPTKPQRTDTGATAVGTASVDIPMSEIFALGSSQNQLSPLAAAGRAKAQACYSPETAFGQFSPAGGSLASMLGRLGSGIDSGPPFCADSPQQKSC
ncbi:hypothetical protein H4S02_004874, partial [Coemansia sp. RSA 2611]